MVEDEPLLAFDYQDEFEGHGAFASVALTLQEAFDALKLRRPDFAVLDVNLGSEVSWPVAIQLSRSQIPFVLVSGFAMASNIPQDVRPLACIEKPIAAAAITKCITALMSPF